MTSLTFTVPGKPEGQRRPRAVSFGGKARVHDDPRNQSYADRIRWAWRAAGAVELGLEPIALRVLVTVERPSTHWKKDGTLSAAGRREVVCIRKPDLDNVVKAVGDALNGLAWRDDAQIMSVSAGRLWAPFGEQGSVHVAATALAEEIAA